MNIDYIIANFPYYLNKIQNSSLFFALKFFLSVYAVVLLVNIILLLALRGLGADWRTTLKGMDIAVASKSKTNKRWQEILRRLQSASESQHKAAILEADRFVEEILSGIGYKGKNMAEKLDQVKPGQLENVEELRKAHDVRNEIVHQKDYAISKDAAREILETYENFLREVEVI